MIVNIKTIYKRNSISVILLFILAFGHFSDYSHGEDAELSFLAFASSVRALGELEEGFQKEAEGDEDAASVIIAIRGPRSVDLYALHSRFENSARFFVLCHGSVSPIGGNSLGYRLTINFYPVGKSIDEMNSVVVRIYNRDIQISDEVESNQVVADGIIIKRFTKRKDNSTSITRTFASLEMIDDSTREIINLAQASQ